MRTFSLTVRSSRSDCAQAHVSAHGGGGRPKRMARCLRGIGGTDRTWVSVVQLCGMEQEAAAQRDVPHHTRRRALRPCANGPNAVPLSDARGQPRLTEWAASRHSSSARRVSAGGVAMAACGRRLESVDSAQSVVHAGSQLRGIVRPLSLGVSARPCACIPRTLFTVAHAHRSVRFDRVCATWWMSELGHSCAAGWAGMLGRRHRVCRACNRRVRR